jgi:hypothetical protein
MIAKLVTLLAFASGVPLTVRGAEAASANANDLAKPPRGAGRPDTIGVRRPSNGFFYLRNANSSGPEDYLIVYGLTTDIGLAGDWNNDGIDTVGFYRPSNTGFTLSNTAAASIVGLPVTAFAFGYGSLGDKPIVGDWDGNGSDSVGVFRGSNRTFFLRSALSGSPITTSTVTVPFANATDVPVTGDWDCNGTTTVGLYRPANATFYLTNTGTGVPTDFTIITFGAVNASPFTGDFDNDGCTEIATFLNGAVRVRGDVSASGAVIFNFNYGVAGDQPLSGTWHIP